MPTMALETLARDETMYQRGMTLLTEKLQAAAKALRAANLPTAIVVEAMEFQEGLMRVVRETLHDSDGDWDGTTFELSDADRRVWAAGCLLVISELTAKMVNGALLLGDDRPFLDRIAAVQHLADRLAGQLSLVP